MNLAYFISGRIGKEGERSGISQPMMKISIAGVAVGIIVMILTLAIVRGFKNEIKNQVTGFASFITLTSYKSGSVFETSPIYRNKEIEEYAQNIPNVLYIQTYALKAGIVKSGREVEGVFLKGVERNYNWDFVRKNLVEGNVLYLDSLEKTDEVIISNRMADKLKLSVGDKFNCYFTQDPVRVRRFIVSGIFNASLEEFGHLMFVDMRHIQRLNAWDENQVSAYEVFVKEFEDMNPVRNEIQSQLNLMMQPDSEPIRVQTIEEKYPSLFVWIEQFNTNTYVIIILLILVAGFNMISGFLIMVLERISFIGVLKAIGMTNWSIRKVFIYSVLRISFKGLIIGNIIGLAICFLQQKFKFISLDPTSYYIDFVPISIDFWSILLLNTGSFIAISLMLILPSYFISRFSPSEAIGKQ